MEIGERIRQRRIELGLTQEELAHKLGYTSKSTIAKIESNSNNLRQTKIYEISVALDTTPGWILGWDDEPLYEDIEEKNDTLIKLMVSYEERDYINKLKELPIELKEAVYQQIDYFYYISHKGV